MTPLFLRKERRSLFRQAEQERTTGHSGKRSEGETYSSVAEKKKPDRMPGFRIRSQVREQAGCCCLLIVLARPRNAGERFGFQLGGVSDKQNSSALGINGCAETDQRRACSHSHVQTRAMQHNEQSPCSRAIIITPGQSRSQQPELLTGAGDLHPRAFLEESVSGPSCGRTAGPPPSSCGSA